MQREAFRLLDLLLDQIRQFEIFHEDVEEFLPAQHEPEIILAVSVRGAFRAAPPASTIRPWNGIAFDELFIARHHMLAQSARGGAVERGFPHATRGYRDLVAVLDILDVALARAVAHRLDDLFLGAAQEALAVGQAFALGIEAPVNDVHVSDIPFRQPACFTLMYHSTSRRT